jgi:hypothetical protein
MSARGVLGRLVLVAAALPFGACCLLVRPPEAEELLAAGFRTPEQTFRTFQLGWRGDLPDLEHRCLSRGWRERDRISRLNYREFRAALVDQEPFLRLGIADAEPTGAPEIHGDRALLRAESHGRTIEVRLVLDDFVEVWSGGERLVDEYAPFEDHTQVQAVEGGVERLWGHVQLPAGAAERRPTELRLGREWKIDGLEIVEEP